MESFLSVHALLESDTSFTCDCSSMIKEHTVFVAIVAMFIPIAWSVSKAKRTYTCLPLIQETWERYFKCVLVDSATFFNSFSCVFNHNTKRCALWPDKQEKTGARVIPLFSTMTCVTPDSRSAFIPLF